MRLARCMGRHEDLIGHVHAINGDAAGDEVAVVAAGAGQGGTTGHEHQRGKHGDMTEQRVKQRERHDGFRLGAWAIVTMRCRADSLRRITMSVGRWPISPVAPAPRYCRQQRQFASAPSPGA